MPKLNTARFALSAAATHGALYAVGGFNGEQYMSTVEMLDPRVGRYFCLAFLLHMAQPMHMAQQPDVTFNQGLYMFLSVSVLADAVAEVCLTMLYIGVLYRTKAMYGVADG